MTSQERWPTRWPKRQSIRLRNKAYDYVMKNGLAQVLDLPVKQAGPYQVRAAVMDRTSKLTGSSAQFVFVPDLKNKQLAMSDLTLVTRRVSGGEIRSRNPGATGDVRGRQANLRRISVQRQGR